MTKQEVIDTLVANEFQLVKFGVKRVGLFGSFVREEQTDESDIDVLVEFETGCDTFINLLNLYDFLQGLFARPVEVVTLKSLSPYIGPHILREVEYVPHHN